MSHSYPLYLFATTLALLAPSAVFAQGKLSEAITQCSACHGADGVAKSADVPHLAGQQELYLFNQLKAFRSGKRPHKEMRNMSRQLTDNEIAEIARHYATMKR